MLSIGSSSIPSVSWPAAPSTAVAAVPAVPGVTAVRASPRESQAETGRHGQGARKGPTPGVPRPASDAVSGAPTAQAAPLLPRERSDDAGSSPARDLEARAGQRKEDEKKALEQAAQQRQLQEVLSNVWKASAAVVDVVLGREAASAAQEAGAGARSPMVTSAPASDQAIATEWAGGPPARVTGLPVVARRDQEPPMYTEQGASSWPSLESGSLLNRRV